jgi:pSer/pThr/pTyr-binding forkhead associated (FHA) protein
MSFGILTILGEGGEVGEVELTKPTTSIGRQPGNDIVLNTSAVSRYHAQFDVAEGRVFLVDLGTVNGTFINDRRLETNGRIPVVDGDIIMMGDVQLIFHAPKTYFRAIDVEADLAPSTTLFENPHMAASLSVDDPYQPVAPGSHLQLAMIIHNRDEVDHVFIVEVGGMDSEWVRVNRREAHLEPDEQTEILFSIRPPRSATTRPGRYPLTIRVAYKEDPTQTIEAVREIEIVGFTGVAMASHEGKQKGAYQLAVQNQGNIPIDLKLGGYQHERLLRYRFSSSRLHLEPGQTAQVEVQVRPSGGRPFGRARRVSFAIVVRSVDKANYQAPLLEKYTITPSWPAWLAGLSLPLILVGGLATLVLLAILIFSGVLPLAFLKPDTDDVGAAATASLEPTLIPSVIPTLIPTPVVSIADFQVQPSEADLGRVSQVTYVWQVEGPSYVASYTLLESMSGQILPIEPENWSTGQLAVPVGVLVEAFGWGRHEYTLTLLGTDQVERSRTVAVTIQPVVCTLRPDGQIVPLPTANSKATPLAPPSILEVAIGGRSSDGQWLQIWSVTDHHELGWTQVEGVTCPVGITPGEFIIVDATLAATVTP